MRNRHPKWRPDWRIPASLMLLGSVLAWPGVAAAASCNVSPSNPTVNVGGTVNWSTSVSDMRSRRTYEWEFNAGNPSNSTSSSPTVRYDQVGTTETKLKVSDRRSEAECKTTVTVRAASDTQAPSRPSNLAATAVSSSQIDLTWSASTDNVGVTGYQVFRCEGSRCTPSTQIATATDTNYNDTGVTANTRYRYSVRATDAAGNLSTDSSRVYARTPSGGPVNQPPTANAGPDQTLTLASGQTTINVTLNGSGSSDSDGTITTYNWTGNPNPADVVSPTVNLSAGSYTFTLVVTDNDGDSSAPDTVNVTVNPAPPVNQAPTANAGPDQTVTLAAGQNNIAVTLNGSGSSDSDGSIASYTWTGNPNPADVVSPTVTLSAGTYTFTLVVTDNDGDSSAPDTVNVTVNPAPPVNQAPTANAGPDQAVTIAAGQSNIAVILNGTGSSDPDGTITTYNWTGNPNPVNTVSPTVTLTEGTYTFTLVVTDNDGASSAPDTVLITVNAAPPVNQSPTANAGTDQSLVLPMGETAMEVTLDGTGSSDSDGSVVAWTWSGNPNPDDVESPTVTLGEGSHVFSLVVTDDDGADSNSDSVTVTITAPVPGDPHASINAYNGPQTCVACHEDEARSLHGSVHYQQSGPTDYVTNIDGPSGERWNGPSGLGYSGINTYCGAHETSPRFTCAGCHVGNGRFPKTADELLGLDDVGQLKELSNIDCMMCHQEQYKRFPDPMGLGFEDLLIVSVGADGKPDPSAPPIVRTGLEGIPIVDPVTLDFDFVPADPTNPDLDGVPAALMPISALEAARTVHATTRKSCLNCHAGAGGADGTKRGDMSTALIAPDTHIDYHMSDGGAGLVCADCHAAGNHRVLGRGVDLRPNDVSERLTCAGCHGERPHGDYDSRDGTARDTHAEHVACQSCHIPTFAKGVATEVSRDWEDPHYSAAACNGRGGWLPREDKLADMIPTYQWFDGTSEVYYLTEPLAGVPQIPLSNQEASALGLPNGSQAYVLGMPNGDVSSRDAKLAPMKEHLGKVARNMITDTLVAHSTFEFFRTGNFEQAILSGLEQTADMAVDDPYEIVGVHTYQSINHGVEVSNDALACGACHGSLSGGPARMDLQGELGYQLKGPTSTVCRQCHGSENNMSFSKIHEKHVDDKRKDCSTCHTFSRPERGLSTSTN